MSNDQSNIKLKNPKYDLEERTIRFSKNVIDLLKIIPENNLTKPVINQLIRSATSIGANYHEADEASSKKYFINKVLIAKKETKETKYWLRIISHIYPPCIEKSRFLWKETQEFNLIFSSIIINCKKKKEN
uniref:Four helix bundle protein n=1 Tax=candidate division CPR3 bacterium TaxID=2268181 RepID=A0A7C4M5D8_UNCC3